MRSLPTGPLLGICPRLARGPQTPCSFIQRHQVIAGDD
eukprot:UN10087